jgi:endonuclease/exonuclease/phosphatase (EEP) superfamily protein YafD
VSIVVIVGWLAVAAMLLVLVTQLIGWSGAVVVVVLQTATPFLLATSVPIAGIAAVSGRWLLAATAGLSAVALAMMLWRMRVAPLQAGVSADTQPLRLFHGNLLYYNPRTAEMARVVADLDADLLAFTEYTPTHAGGLYVTSLMERFPHRIEHPEQRAGGSALWSRYPLTEIPAPEALYLSTAAVVHAPEPVTVYVVHPPNPLHDLTDWLGDLSRLAALGRTADSPTIVVGDFNATYWHPPFRRLLASGWRDAHQLAGQTYSCSWPTDKWWLPPFMRLDHALVNESLVVAEVVDVDVPGSDHRGLLVAATVSRSVPAALTERSR